MSAPVVLLRDVVCPLGNGPTLKLDRFDVQAGQQWVLTGPSGCGKSSLLNIIAGVLPLQSGECSVLGKDLTSLSSNERDQLRGREIGLIFQNFNLLDPFTVQENVHLVLHFAGKSDRSDRARDLLVRVGLEHRLHAKPAGLSIGERQRVAVARALAPEPSLLLADEPTGSLDPVAAKQVCELIQSMCRGLNTPLVFVTHDEGLTSQFDDHLDGADLIREGVSL